MVEILLEGRVTANHCEFIMTDYLYPVMKYFCPDESRLFQDGNDRIQSMKGVVSIKFAVKICYNFTVIRSAITYNVTWLNVQNAKHR